MSFLPTGAMVAVAWIRSLPQLAAGVSTRLPQDASTWATEGFVVVTTVGGTGSRNVDMRITVVSVDAWAVALNSGQAPIGKAGHVAEVVRAATFDHDSFPALVTPGPGDYRQARVHGAWCPLPEPRQIPDPEGNRAHVTFDLAIQWTALPEE
jgi:hypothetical protein